MTTPDSTSEFGLNGVDVFLRLSLTVHIKHKLIETWIEIQPGMFLKSPRRIRAYRPAHKYKPTDKEKRRKQQREYKRLFVLRNRLKKNEVPKDDALSL